VSTSISRRSDARANRERVLAAAVECFTEDGMDTQMVDIARCAGVGIGTVYRHFPSKDALVAALATDCLTGLLAKATLSLEDPDPWHGLTEFVWYATERQATDRIASEAATDGPPHSATYAMARGRSALRSAASSAKAPPRK